MSTHQCPHCLLAFLSAAVLVSLPLGVAAGVDVAAGAASVDICCSETPLAIHVAARRTNDLPSKGRLAIEHPVVGGIVCEIITHSTPQLWLNDLLEREGQPQGKTAYISASNDRDHIQNLLIDRGGRTETRPVGCGSIQ